MTNQLGNESSPYLLQHAQNPVHWVAWSEDVFERAKAEDKMVLISVGYSACHWCHVMEHECFEDEEVAALMNAHFINIKVDREERPDVDQIYMTAVQLMTQRGGWPLNCFTLPDGRPIYGGTYFPKDQWMHILKSLAHTYANDRAKAIDYARQLHEGIQQAELIAAPAEISGFEAERLHEMVVRWARSFDTFEGGTNKAPKFPLPNNWLFLLRYAQQFDEAKIEKQVRLTLDKIALGGIYDQVGGGFTRYSVDVLWKVPHFEKMLYDNGQLIGLYAQAFAAYQTTHFKDVVFQTFDFLERELRSDLGAYFSALDADSEGEEGKFYCWTPNEIDQLFGAQAERVKRYYHINQTGHWEEGKHIPLRKQTDAAFAKMEGLDLDVWLEQKAQINETLLRERSLRVRPGLDNKLLVSWNAMTAKGLLEAYRVFGEDAFLIRALKILSWIKDVQWDGQQLLRVNTNQQKTVTAFLEDYAHTIEALSLAYQCTGQLDFLAFAKTLTEKVANEFQHPQSKMCYFTASDSTLISRNMDLHDNVIASSNSVMAHAFLTMGFYYQNQEWTNSAEQMLQNIYDGMETYGSGYSNWGLLLFRQLYPEKHWHVLNSAAPMEVFQATKQIDCLLSYHQSLPCSEIYTVGAISVCEFGSCQRPVQTVAEALAF
ncbi:MAG: thioredoxin domain-containing protein [Crocinitomicaceae bacterium]|nr:thioredoxin domain-containing protein [Crocinitomicaceae bacterium]MDP4739206.1 thioredoxin domain-containing protein [Crocinitomicaceae bacterium]MDP4799620.1 thioredoxin domain-containing protein [Crocinitomicaceae bacterium]MDP4868087.1 thioredoxin domain-containing protein [Crocinitomicaceae bacterium]MDP4955713.1 thioredoxin domain-containing protein [Crocinitomicaceae bacterium]